MNKLFSNESESILEQVFLTLFSKLRREKNPRIACIKLVL